MINCLDGTVLITKSPRLPNLDGDPGDVPELHQLAAVVAAAAAVVQGHVCLRPDVAKLQLEPAGEVEGDGEEEDDGALGHAVL